MIKTYTADDKHEFMRDWMFMGGALGAVLIIGLATALVQYHGLPMAYIWGALGGVATSSVGTVAARIGATWWRATSDE